MNDDSLLLRTLLIPIKGAQILVPSASVLEVLPLSSPEPVEDSPDWILGTLSWRTGSIPVVALETLFNGEPPELGSRTRLAIINPVGETGTLMHYALVAQAVPRLVTLERHMIHAADYGAPLPRGVTSKALLASQEVLIPDLAEIETLLVDGMALADEVIG
jgi:chemosensory pili system protein ChpC